MGKRYVMGNRADGLSDILIEDEVVLTLEKPYKELWKNTETPADMSATGDAVPDPYTIMHEPPDGGAMFRVVSFAPKGAPVPTPEQMIEIHKNVLHSANIPTLEYLRKAKHVSMHRTDTLNYFIMIEGEVWSLSEGRDVLLKPGDVMVQKGCMHAWRNDSDKRAVLVAVLVDAIPPK
jgi:quercetin dioxygenase-like cupin family protein